MVSFPNAKINLGLNVTAKRGDGFHNIETVFFPVAGLTDVLEIVESDRFSFDVTGIGSDMLAEDNLCTKAFRLMAAQYPLPPVSIHLHKTIPQGAGLGGGSSDASFTLLSLNRIFDLRLSNAELKAVAAQLGSDCAFFIDNVPSKASGRGEILEPVPLNLSGLYMALIKPDIHVSTREAYGAVVPQSPVCDIADIVGLPPNEWKNILTNDFEKSIFPKYPAIADVKEKMYSRGAIYASMSGSGASVFGLFEKQPKTDDFIDSSCGISYFAKTYFID